MAKKETWSLDGAVCPHCGDTTYPWDDAYALYDESISEWHCESCGKDFNVSVYVSHSWTCTPKEERKPCENFESGKEPRVQSPMGEG